MPLEISYCTSRAVDAPAVGAFIPGARQSLTLSSSAATSGVTPPEANWVSLTATEAARFEYNGGAVASTSHYIGSGERVWMAAIPGATVSARTA